MPTLDDLKTKAAAADELFMTTKRTTGQATYPLWFVHDGQRLYILSAESSSEVWDVKRDPKVDVAIGAPGSPDRLAMQADVMPDPAWVPQMVDLLKKKYGAKHADRMARTAESAKGGHVVIKLKPV